MAAEQLALSVDATPATKPGAVLRVNEAKVNLYTPRDTANWWALFRAHGPAARFTVIKTALPGDLVDVACDDRAHAEDLRAACIDRGIPKTALTIHRPDDTTGA